MKNNLSVLFLLLFHFASAQISPEVRAILNTQDNRFRAMTSRDTATLSRFLSDDLVYIHSNAMTEDKEKHLQAIASGKTIYEKIIGQEAKVRLYGKIAIVNGQVNVSGKLNGQSFDIVLTFTAVYRKNKGRWLMASWQSTRLP